MSGIFGVVSEEDCVHDLFYGTDYHSHLGKKIGGMAVFDGKKFHNEIKAIDIYPFRPQLDKFRLGVSGKQGIGVIGDYEPQPLILGSPLGDYAIAHVGKVNNLDALVLAAYKRKDHFNEMSLGEVNPTELIGTLINQGKSYIDGIEIMQNNIKGSSSIMLLTREGIYVSRDKYGRTPINIGKKEGSMAASFESFALDNLGFENIHYLGPGEIGILTNKGYEQLKPSENLLQICTFLWIYYGNPGTVYENLGVEDIRNNLGKTLAKADKEKIKRLDYVAGIPNSGNAGAFGYSNEAYLPLKRPFIKYDETWQRSFMPQDDQTRKFVAKMKLIVLPRLIRGAKAEIIDDSLVRGNQSEDQFNIFFSHGAEEAHFGLTCPPINYGCKFLNFSRSKSEEELAVRKAIIEIEGKSILDISKYVDETSGAHIEMVERIRRTVGVTTLQYQRLNDMVSAIGLPKEKLCTYCWDECDPTKCKIKS